MSVSDCRFFSSPPVSSDTHISTLSAEKPDNVSPVLVEYVDAPA